MVCNSFDNYVASFIMILWMIIYSVNGNLSGHLLVNFRWPHGIHSPVSSSYTRTVSIFPKYFPSRDFSIFSARSSPRLQLERDREWNWAPSAPPPPILPPPPAPPLTPAAAMLVRSGYHLLLYIRKSLLFLPFPLTQMSLLLRAWRM